ncbi:MAG: hypothetical protein GX886_16145, partial [Comamonadaceae bacterium]|nr:hypothetical protein [Comamonadaceae bacterium]
MQPSPAGLFAHRLQPVGAQVRHGLVDQGRIAVDRGMRGVQPRVDRELRGQRCGEQLQHLGDQRLQQEGRVRARRAAAEREDAL